jgi:hypothetical protein
MSHRYFIVHAWLARDDHYGRGQLIGPLPGAIGERGRVLTRQRRKLKIGAGHHGS